MLTAWHTSLPPADLAGPAPRAAAESGWPAAPVASRAPLCAVCAQCPSALSRGDMNEVFWVFFNDLK